MQLFFQPDIRNGSTFLNEEESKHCIKVLRHTVGDTLEVVDGAGAKFKVRITDANARKTSFDIISHERKPELPYYIHIALAPTKQIERTEWFLEKAVEIGVDEISFFFSRNSERKNLKMDRMYKKAIAAMKQSLKYQLPKIELYDDLKSLLEYSNPDNDRFIAYVDFSNPVSLKKAALAKRRTTVIIGPEGDFTPEELELALKSGFEKVSLGPSRLRTETAGVVACHTLNLINNE